ncbi:MAG TPA: chloride channel protein [Hydrogenophaga sp.]|uniref:chloride channel protein n=1 Tax=Hydrogenophaga sp. TaxID=1904254 RepID=UPI002CB86D6E|nr:chloride channel protein [Hydrogenophaga sp.]HMN93260.1 chloride channel protein [Hydrogenophaga sp.]HMP10823.1 chloride channel protein [Hydrogenophaga sp.]
MKGEPDFLRNVRDEVVDARQWLDRAIIIAYAVLAGLAVVGFTLLADAAFGAYQNMRGAIWWWPLVWTPAVTALVVWLVRRWAPGAAGSGVPQVLTALAPETPLDTRGRFVSLKLSIAKILAVSGGLLAGLSIGRQGPSVQVAAGIMLHARRWLSPRSGISDRELLVAGGAAGIAAAFNTPLGGIVFAIEELSRRLMERSSALMLVAIVVAGLVAVSAFGNLSYFGRVRTDGVSWWGLIGPGTVVAVACGLLGGLLARLMLASFTGLPDRFCAYRRKRPVAFAAICGFVVAVIAVISGGAAVGVGHQHTHLLLEQAATDPQAHTPLLFTGLKFIASWLSAWTGMPGGIFGPSLSLGAGVGADIAWLLDSPHGMALIALGMCGFLAAVTQTPITAMIIVMEMTDGHGMVLSLMACALVASGVSRMISRPLYSTMSALMLRSVRPAEESTDSRLTEPGPDSRPGQESAPR